MSMFLNATADINTYIDQAMRSFVATIMPQPVKPAFLNRVLKL